MAKKRTEKKQADLPGVEGAGVSHVSIPELDEAAANYARVRDRRMDLTKKEVEAKTKLIDLMHAHESVIGKDEDGVMHYIYDDQEVLLRPTGEELKVRTYVDPGAPE